MLAAIAALIAVVVKWRPTTASAPIGQNQAGAEQAPAAPPSMSVERERVMQPTPAELHRLDLAPDEPLLAEPPRDPLDIAHLTPDPFGADFPRRLPPYMRRPPGSISFEVFDAETSRRIFEFEYAVEVIGSPPTHGSSNESRQTSATAPVDIPFNLRIEANGYETHWLRQVILRNGQEESTHTIRLQPAR